MYCETISRPMSPLMHDSLIFSMVLHSLQQFASVPAKVIAGSARMPAARIGRRFAVCFFISWLVWFGLVYSAMREVPKSQARRLAGNPHSAKKFLSTALRQDQAKELRVR